MPRLATFERTSKSTVKSPRFCHVLRDNPTFPLVPATGSVTSLVTDYVTISPQSAGTGPSADDRPAGASVARMPRLATLERTSKSTVKPPRFCHVIRDNFTSRTGHRTESVTNLVTYYVTSIYEQDPEMKPPAGRLRGATAATHFWPGRSTRPTTPAPGHPREQV